MPRDTLVVNEIPVACFAPPLTDEKLARFKELAEEEGGETGDAMTQLWGCVAAWWDIPESARSDGDRWKLHLDGGNGPQVVVAEIPLEDGQVNELDAVTPYMRELETLSKPDGSGLFDTLPPGEMRDAAFTLLWYATEITLGREPLTQDVLAKASEAHAAKTAKAKPSTPRRKS